MISASLFFIGCGGGSSGSSSTNVNTTSNTLPVANAGNDLTAQVGQTITITGSGTDSDGSIISYTWSKGTALLATTASFEYTPTTEGTDSLTLSVTDNEGAIATDSMNVTVTTTIAPNNPPAANAGDDLTTQVGQTITITGSGTDSDGTIASYAWYKGTTLLATTASFEYTPTTTGTDTLNLTVTDNDGAIASDSMVVKVESHLTLDDFANATPHDPSFELTHFSGSQNCAGCHDGIKDTSNNEDVSIAKAWQGTMMANAATDPLYLAKVASEVQRNPHVKDIIEDKCSRCHMPMANVEAGFTGETIAISGDGFTNPNNPHYDAAKEGVSCTLCHQIENTPQLGTTEGSSGEFVIAENYATDRVSYGPYTNPRTGPMVQNAGFTPQYSAHMNDSKLCSSCHNLDTPVIDAQGNLTTSTFPEQAVYTEWEYSDFNATTSCQECHMPKTEGSVVISTQGGNLQARSPFHQHKFLGANTYMLDILKNNRTKLGAIADTARFNESISDTREFLKAAASVNVTTTSFDNETLHFSVKVTNHSGHKFPTSIPIRRAWLHVKVTDASNQTVFESGAMNNNGQIIGIDDHNGYEEHHEKIDDDSEVQVYEAIMVDTDGNQTYTFLNASRYTKDNRILPKGFKDSAPANAQVYGEALEDSDFIGGSDTVNYEINDLVNDEYTISVTLKYQTVSYGFMQDLYKDINLTEVALMKVLDDNADIHFEEISTDTSTYTP